MLYDLTRVSGERVKQVDELHVGGRVWIASTNLFLLLGGAAMGALVASALRLVFAGNWLVYCLIPVGALVAVVLFSRKRSRAGEVNQRRWDKWRDRHGQPDHEFILPGNPEPFLPNQREIVLWHCHSYKP